MNGLRVRGSTKTVPSQGEPAGIYTSVRDPGRAHNSNRAAVAHEIATARLPPKVVHAMCWAASQALATLDDAMLVVHGWWYAVRAGQ